jgi:hypothetical protein
MASSANTWFKIKRAKPKKQASQFMHGKNARWAERDANAPAGGANMSNRARKAPAGSWAVICPASSMPGRKPQGAMHTLLRSGSRTNPTGGERLASVIAVHAGP